MSPLGVFVRHKHFISDIVLQSADVYSVLAKFSTHDFAQSGTTSHRDDLELTDVLAEHKAINGRTAASILYVGWKSIL